MQMGETDLAMLLAKMEPVLFREPYGFAIWQGALPEETFATVREAEGLTVIAPLAVLGGVEPWARISLTVHSDLAAVGLTAAFAAALARVGISCNVIAGVHHDHLFVQWDRRGDAMAALRGLSDV
ncbi:MAG: ACT domain-containing protein [Hyphomicrobiales bacterium]|nr:MAG: ACT domain-containing protein [Hyphomicrobiales bacterium]